MPIKFSSWKPNALCLNGFIATGTKTELKFQFIAQIVELVDLHGKNYNIFSQRNLSAVVNGINLQGRPEVMIATWQEDPLRPYFFIHEYKPSKCNPRSRRQRTLVH